MDADSYFKARANLNAMIDKVAADCAVLVSASEWASIEETLYLLRSPANAKRLLMSVAELEADGGEEHELIRP